MPKTLHLHIGPHVSGEESIRSFIESISHSRELASYSPGLQHRLDDVGEMFRIGSSSQSMDLIRSIGATITSASGDCFIGSCVSLCGELPSAIGRRRVYARIFENLSLFAEAIEPVDCRFYFFRREPIAWAHDVYLYHLRANRKYRSFDRFCEVNRIDEVWDGVLRRCRNRFGRRFCEISLDESSDVAPAQSFAKAVLGDAYLNLPWPNYNRHRELSDTQIATLERLNRGPGSEHAVAQAKALFLQGQSLGSLEDPAVGLSGLALRTKSRIEKQDVTWELPELTFPLGDLWYKMIPEEDVDFPNVTRVSMKGQARILRFRMRGLPEPCFLLGMVISYLRRDTDYTERSLGLFMMLWEQEYVNLLAYLPTRWLISTLQTFLDHGRTSEQRIIGASGYFFANTVKAYEAERALDGLEPDKVYDNIVPKIEKSGGLGLDRFDLGRTDLMVNTLSLLYEVSLSDVVAGRVLREFLLRIRGGYTLFSRMDQSRIAHGIEPQGFRDCWSFFEKPRGSV